MLRVMGVAESPCLGKPLPAWPLRRSVLALQHLAPAGGGKACKVVAIGGHINISQVHWLSLFAYTAERMGNRLCKPCDGPVLMQTASQCI